MDANDDGTTSLSKSSVSAPVVYVRDRRLCTGVLVPSGPAEDAIPAAAPTPAPLPHLRSRSHSQAGAPSLPPCLNHCIIDPSLCLSLSLSLSPHTNTKPEKNTKTPNTKSNTKPKPDALRLFQPLSEPVRAFQQLKKRRRSSCGRNEAAIAAFTKTASRQLLLRQTVLYVTFILLPP
jgi:hypothetical protein